MKRDILEEIIEINDMKIFKNDDYLEYKTSKIYDLIIKKLFIIFRMLFRTFSIDINFYLEHYKKILYILKEYNNVYKGKEKYLIDNNLTKMIRLNNYIFPIYNILFNKNNLNGFYNLYDDFNVENYKLDDIDKFVYHLNMELYNKSIDIFNYLLRIVIIIKLIIDNIKKVNEEIDDKIKTHQKKLFKSSSSSSSNDFRETMLRSLNINVKKDSIKKDDIIDKIFLLLSRVNEDDLMRIKNDLIRKKIYLEDNYQDFIKIQSLRNLKKILKVLEENKKDDVLDKLNRIRNFINDFRNIYICDFNRNIRIYYEINYHSTIKEEIIYSDLKNKNLISDNIRFYSNISNDKLNLRLYELKKELSVIHYYNSSYDEITNLLYILGLYENIVSKKLTDYNINKNIDLIKKILNKYPLTYYDNFKDRISKINSHYKFHYDMNNINNLNELIEYLNVFYLYKNYVYQIKNLYDFYLSIKDNFNLSYMTITNIKKININKLNQILLEELLKELNKINRKHNIEITFETYEEFIQFINI